MHKPLAFVIEDYADQALVFSKALEVAGYETESIADGAVASQRLKEIIPDLVVLDLHMPNITGEMLLKQIRSDSRLAGARVVLATADAQFASKLQVDADLVLLKPIGFTQLSQLARRFLDEMPK